MPSQESVKQKILSANLIEYPVRLRPPLRKRESISPPKIQLNIYSVCLKDSFAIASKAAIIATSV